MKKITATLAIVVFFASCKKNIVVSIPPSNGTTMVLNGLDGTEPKGDGAFARNSVFVDLSAEKQITVPRTSWDLGFYTGDDFRVIINNTTFAMVKVTNQTDINAVTEADLGTEKLEFSHATPPLLTSGIADDPDGHLSKTAIPVISVADADNKVVIINRGTGGGIEKRPFMKIRILRSNNGYLLQYAELAATSYKTVQVSKMKDRTFVRVSLDDGMLQSAFPTRDNWDLQWGYSVMAFRTFYFGYSDIVSINHLNGAQAFTASYGSNAAARKAFTLFNKDSVAKYQFLPDKNTIGSTWRLLGPWNDNIVQNQFFVIKDAEGNIYKLKFISFSSSSGGVRGNPEFLYEIIKWQ